MKKLLIVTFSLCTYISLKAQQIPSIIDRFTGQQIARKINSSLGTNKPCPLVIYGETTYARLRYDTSISRDGTRKITPKIIIDTNKVVKKLAAFGHKADDALAAIIGHEMWHYYQGQGNYFFGSWPDSLHQSMEKEADYYGLMLAYFAGYKDVMAVYDQIFDTLNFPSSPDYPDIATRKALDDFIKERAIEMTQVYDVGHIFLSNGSSPFCEMAITCYRHCGEKMLYLKEINYQLGLAFLMRGLNERGQNEYWLPLPFQQNPYADLNAKKEDLLGRRMLDSASYYFHLASQQDPAFLDASFGEICTQVMKNTTLADSLIDVELEQRGYGVLGLDLRKEERRDYGRLLLLKATAGLYRQETKAAALRQLDLLILQRPDEDSIAPYARANLALAKGYVNPNVNFPPLKGLDNIQHDATKNSFVFVNDEWLSPSDHYRYRVKTLPNSTIFSWRDDRNAKCIIQYYRVYPFKKNQLRGLNPAAQPARAWFYSKYEEYDLLIRPKENVPGEMECIKIIHNVQ